MKQKSISVIIPIKNINNHFSQIQKAIYQATNPIEIIYVIDKKLQVDIKHTKEFEILIREHNHGRGHMLKKGMEFAHGEIIVFLHADTLLPPKWDQTIIDQMNKPKVIGGAFKLSFINQNSYLTIGIKIIDLLFQYIGVLSGDRAIFVRTKPLRNNLHILDVPIYEDAELSHWMKHNGDVVILNDAIKTSSDAFYNRGMLRQTWRIIICSLWYAVGRDLTKIHYYYYH
jgi:cellulose synthase/poly-beta-1,6-N-acetylglucosamine synthase-like glycosyltransferase